MKEGWIKIDEEWMKNDEGWMKNDEGWMKKMKDEWRMMKDEWRMMKDEWKIMKDEWWRRMISSCWGVLLTDRQMDERMNERTDICESRVAFATEKIAIQMGLNSSLNNNFMNTLILQSVIVSN